MKLHQRQHHRSHARSGMTVLEVTIALAVTATILLASAASFMSSIAAVNSAERTSRGTVFAETVMEDLTAQPYANLLSFNGNRVFDQPTAAAAHYAVDLTVFTAAVDLIQMRAVLTDLQTGRELARMTTLRARR